MNGLSERDTTTPTQTVANLVVPDPRRVIRTGSIIVRVEKAEQAEKSIADLLAPGPGYIENSNLEGFDQGSPKVTMKIRVPSNKFEKIMESIASLGVVIGKKISTKDVSLEIADISAVLKTHLEKETALIEKLRVAKNEGEIQSLENSLAEVRSAIDRIKAQEKALSNLADLSTIDVTLTQETSTAVSPSDPNWFSQTLASASSSFMTVFRGVATLTIWIALFSPYLLIFAMIAFAIYKRKTVIAK